jgi:cell division protein FtsL
MLTGIMLVVGLYFVKTRASQAKSHARKLEHTVEQEEASVRMLRAEIAHLENPERLRRLSGKHLNLQPVEAERILTLEQAVQVLPKKPTPSPDRDGGADE